MKNYMRFISILILLIGAVCFYLSYELYQLPYDEQGIFIKRNGEVVKRAAATKALIFGVLSILFVLVWNVIYKKISKKD